METELLQTGGTMRFTLKRRLLILGAVLLTGSTVCWGQQSTTSLRGVVTDKQAAGVPTAAVVLRRPDTGFRRSVLTDAAGRYEFPQVPPGAYTVTAKKPGFADLERTGVELLVNTPAELNLTLEIASLNESVNVEAEAPTINTNDA